MGEGRKAEVGPLTEREPRAPAGPSVVCESEHLGIGGEERRGGRERRERGGYLERSNTEAWNLLCLPAVGAGEEADLLFESEL